MSGPATSSRAISASACPIAQSSSRVSSGHVDMAAERRASSRATVAGSSSTPAVLTRSTTPASSVTARRWSWRRFHSTACSMRRRASSSGSNGSSAWASCASRSARTYRTAAGMRASAATARLTRVGMAIAVARIAPATQPSWNRVSKRANDLPLEASGACVWTIASKPCRATAATPPRTSDTTTTRARDAPSAPKATTTASATSAPAVSRSSPKRRRSSGATALPANVPTP